MTNINLVQGDSTTLTETVEGLTALSGYSGKLYIYTKAGTLVDTIVGTVSGLTVVYQILNEDSKQYPLGTHDFETKIWDSADHVYTTTHGGTINVERALNIDPS